MPNPKVFISPSSQERNAYATGTNEEIQMNKIADILCPELTRHGIEFLRNSPAKTFREFILQSDAYEPDAHIAIHSNAGDGKARGGEVFCYNPANVNSKGTKLAKAIYKYLEPLTPTADRGIKSGIGHLSEVTQTDAPAVLIEIDFHDKLDGAIWIQEHINEIAYAILNGILDYFGIEFKAVLPDPVIPDVTPPSLGHSIGQDVTFTTCYVSSVDPNSKAIPVSAMKKKHGVITRIVSAKNPYLLDNGLCWVNDGDINGIYAAPVTHPVVKPVSTTHRVGSTIMFSGVGNGASDGSSKIVRISSPRKGVIKHIEKEARLPFGVNWTSGSWIDCWIAEKNIIS